MKQFALLDTELDLNQFQGAQKEQLCAHGKTFQYWRMRIMLCMIAGYASFYLIRQNFSLAIPAIEQDLGYSKTQIGAIWSAGALLYGLGKAAAGLIGDRMSARYLMTFGLFMSGVTSFYFGLCDNLSHFMTAWVVNMCFQSLGWPSCARLLTHWFSPKELGTKWAVWNSSQQIGGAIILIVGGYLLMHAGWRYVFFVPAIFSMCMAIFLLFAMRDTPESIGLPSMEEHHGLEKNTDDAHMSSWEVLTQQVLRNKLVWYMCIANFFVYVTRMSLFTWGPTMLREMKGSTIYEATSLTAAYDIAGIFGGILAGILSDKFFKGYRGRAGFFFMLGISAAITFLWLSPVGSTWAHLIGMVGIGFMISGPQILVGVAAVDFSSKRTAGVASGLTGTIGYMGTAAAGAGFGALVEYCGWDYTFMVMSVSTLVGAFFFALTWNHRSKLLDETNT